MDKELELMREQLELLQTKLDKEVTLREDTLRKLLKKGAMSLKNRELVNIGIVGGAILLIPIMLYAQHLSLALCIFSGLSYVTGLIYDIWLYRTLHIGHILDQNLVQAQSDLKCYRDISHKCLFYVCLPWLLVFFCWYAYEMITMNQANMMDKSETYHWGFAVGVIVTMLIGGLIGGLIGFFSIYRPQMQLAREMQEQIADLTRED